MSPTYKIGKGRPPEHTRWRPGQSGNPRGRPKGGKHFHRLLAEELNQLVTVTIAGVEQRLTKGELIAQQLARRALQADPRATKLIFDREQYFPSEESPIESKATPAGDESKRAYERLIRNIK